MKAGSLCTGIGGLDLAVEAFFGVDRMAWYAELDSGPCTVLEREWPGIPNLGDLTDTDWSSVEPVDVLTAGYPCQPFSHAGKRKGKNDVRHLWPFVAEAVRVLRPRWVVLENVAGHLSLGFGDVLGDLAEAGFDAEWCLLRASDVGAPHQRARLFIVATDTADLGHERGGPAWGRGDGLADSGHDAPHAEGYPWGVSDGNGEAPTDARGERLSRRPEHDGQPEAGRLTERTARDDADGLGVAPVAWGQYEPAIRRWEHVLGRPAPHPTDEAGRLSPAFVEWMQGYPQGWVDGLSRTQALKALGNAVVPQQGYAALRELRLIEQEAAA